MQARKVLGFPSYRQGKNPQSLRTLINIILLPTDRCSPCPSSSHVPAGPGGLPAQRSAQQLQPDFWGGSVRSLQVSQPFCSYWSLTRVFHSAGQPPRAPQLAEGQLCPLLAASPCSQLLGVGSGQVARRIMKEAGRCELVVSTFL